MADAGGGRELLEPRLGAEESREKLVLYAYSKSFHLFSLTNAVF